MTKHCPPKSRLTRTIPCRYVALMRRVFSLTLFSLIFFPACTPVKGYSGPDLPDNMVSFVGLSYDSDDVDVSRATANGIEFSSSGINLLPGHQQMDLSVKAKEPPYNCNAYPDMNRSGYESCLEDYYSDLRKGKKNLTRCDCYDYLTVRQRCDRRVHDNNCQVDFNSVAGARYDIQVRSYQSRGEASVRAVQTGNGYSSTDGRCSSFGSHTESEDEYVGTGESTAHSHGIYWCQ